MARLNVEIVTPERRMLTSEADEVIVPGGAGLFGVRPGHTPLLSTVEPGPLTVRDGGTSQVWFVDGGFAQVSDDRVMVLANYAEPAANIDVEAARRRLEEAQGRMKGLTPEDAQYSVESATVKRETARMGLARRG